MGCAGTKPVVLGIHGMEYGGTKPAVSGIHGMEYAAGTKPAVSDTHEAGYDTQQRSVLGTVAAASLHDTRL